MQVQYILSNRSQSIVSLPTARGIIQLKPGGSLRIAKELQQASAQGPRHRFGRQIQLLIRRKLITVKRARVPTIGTSFWTVKWHKPVV